MGAVSAVAGLQSFGTHANQAENHLYQHYIELGATDAEAKEPAATQALGPSIAAGAMTAALINLVPLAFKKAGLASATEVLNLLTSSQGSS